MQASMSVCRERCEGRQDTSSPPVRGAGGSLGAWFLVWGEVRPGSGSRRTLALGTATRSGVADWAETRGPPRSPGLSGYPRGGPRADLRDFWERCWLRCRQAPLGPSSGSRLGWGPTSEERRAGREEQPHLRLNPPGLTPRGLRGQSCPGHGSPLRHPPRGPGRLLLLRGRLAPG